MRLKYETSNTARQGTPKIETIELAGYEKGDSFQSDDDKEARNRKWRFKTEASSNTHVSRILQ